MSEAVTPEDIASELRASIVMAAAEKFEIGKEKGMESVKEAFDQLEADELNNPEFIRGFVEGATELWRQLEARVQEMSFSAP